MQVSPGDEEYIVVIDSEETPDSNSSASNPSTIEVYFHGAIESTAPLLGRQGSLNAGQRVPRTIVTTAPGLLTLESTGSTDTVGTFGTNAEVESGGSGGNFKMVLPVDTNTTGASLVVGGQTPETAGNYTLNMDFEVAMTTTSDDTGVTVADGPAWGNTAIGADDTTLQIDGSSDEDYFLFSLSTGNTYGFLDYRDDRRHWPDKTLGHQRNALRPGWADCNGHRRRRRQPFQVQGAGR